MDEKENYSGQMRKGVLEYIICLYLSQKNSYAQELIQQIQDSGLHIVEGTMYPLLSRMLKAEYLEYIWEEADTGHPRKYYSLTQKGKDLTQMMHGLWEEISLAVKSAQK